MLLLSNIFNSNNPMYSSDNDSFLNLISELKELNIAEINFVKSVDLKDVINLTVKETKELIDKNGVLMFEDDYKSIKDERDNLVEYCTKFYTQINSNNLTNKKVERTPQEVIYELYQWEIRLKRMLCVLKPVFNVTDGFNKITKKSYRLLKGYWITDQNERKRIFNKNVGITNGLIEDHYERFFKNRGYEVTVYLKLSNGFKTDLIIEKEGKQKIVEFKLRNKEQFYNQFMSLEMWFKYSETYRKFN